jgi:hypothetical protein
MRPSSNIVWAGLLSACLLAAAAGAAFDVAAAPTVDVRRVPNGGIQPEMATGRDGVIHLVYFSGTPGGGDLFYVSSRDGGQTFSNPLRVNSQPGSAIATGTIRGAQVAVAPDGRVHVAWNGSDKAQPRGLRNPKSGIAGSPMLYARSDLQRTAFEPQRNLMTHTYNLDGGGSLAVDGSGAVYVAWHGNDVNGADGEAARRVWIARSSDGGATFPAETPAWSEPTGACGCCGMRLFASGENRLYLLYRAATQQIHRDVFALVSNDRGRSFRGARVGEWEINACPMTSMSIAASGDHIVGAWETDGQVFFKDLAAAGATAQAPAGGTRETRRKHPRVSFAADGRLLLVWTEGTAWNKGGSLAWQLYDAAGRPSGPAGARPDVPTWSVGAVAARPGGFVIVY